MLPSNNPRENDFDQCPDGYIEQVLKYNASKQGICILEKIHKGDILPLEILIDWVNEVVDLRDENGIIDRLHKVCK